MKDKVYRVKTMAGSSFANLAWYIFLLALSFVLLYPFLYILSGAMQSPSDYTDPTVQWVPRNLYFDNFLLAIEALDLWKSVGVSFVYQILAAMIQVCSCAIAAYGMARFRFRGKALLSALMILHILVPASMIIIPSYVGFRSMDFLGVLGLLKDVIGVDLVPNLLDTPLVFWLPALLGVGLNGGLFIYMFSQFFKGLPKELEEAAWIDGAGPWKTFLRIIIPSSGTVIITTVLFSFIWYWNDDFMPAFYLQGNPTFGLNLADIENSTKYIVREAGASLKGIALNGCVLFLIPPLTLYLILQKRFVSSIATSGIVG